MTERNAERERLIDLLADHCDMRDGRCAPCDNDCKTSRFGKVADYLLANGVVVPPTATDCLTCRHMVGCEPDRMAYHVRPCDLYEERREDDEYKSREKDDAPPLP